MFLHCTGALLRGGIAWGRRLTSLVSGHSKTVFDPAPWSFPLGPMLMRKAAPVGRRGKSARDKARLKVG